LLWESNKPAWTSLLKRKFKDFYEEKASLDELHRSTDSNWLRSICSSIPEYNDAIEDDRKDFESRADAYFRPFKSKFFSSLRECVISIIGDKDQKELQKQKLQEKLKQNSQVFALELDEHQLTNLVNECLTALQLQPSPRWLALIDSKHPKT